MSVSDDPETRSKMTDMARILDGLFEGSGFALFIFAFGEEAQMSYISNADRKDMIRALRRFADKSEASAP
jgi:hypothetical protein